MSEECEYGEYGRYTESDPLEPGSGWRIYDHSVFTETIREPGRRDDEDRVQVKCAHREMIECDRSIIKSSHRKQEREIVETRHQEPYSLGNQEREIVIFSWG
jgi:hypothetical protein